jgi:hypothetical protein
VLDVQSVAATYTSGSTRGLIHIACEHDGDNVVGLGQPSTLLMTCLVLLCVICPTDVYMFASYSDVKKIRRCGGEDAVDVRH